MVLKEAIHLATAGGASSSSLPPAKYRRLSHHGHVTVDPHCERQAVLTHLLTSEKVTIPFEGGYDVVYDDLGMGAFVSSGSGEPQVTLMLDVFKWEVLADSEDNFFKRKRCDPEVRAQLDSTFRRQAPKRRF
jgi:hypothetical protein